MPSTWDPPTALRGIERWFEDLRGDLESRFWEPSFGFDRDAARHPRADLEETDTEYVVTTELPGVSKENVEVTVHPDAVELGVKIDQEHKEEHATYLFQERTRSEVARTISLPAEVRPDDARATLRDGVLEVRLPKREVTPAARPAKVLVT